MKKMLNASRLRSTRRFMKDWIPAFVGMTFLWLCGSVGASTKVTTGSTSWSAIGVLPTDTLYIRAAHAITVNVFDAGLSCVAIIDSGKLIRPAGTRLNVGAMRVTATGLDSIPSGSDAILTVSNDDRLGADDYSVLPGGRFWCQNWSATNKWQMIGTTTNGTLPSFMYTSSQQFFCRGGQVRGFQNSWPNAGWTFSNAGRVNIQRCTFDSASVSLQTSGGHLFRGNTMNIFAGMNRALIVRNSTADTIMGCRIRHNSLGGNSYAGAQGIYVASNNTVVWACNIKDTNFTGSWGGDYGIALEQGYSGTKIMFDTLSGFEFTLASPAGNHPNVFVYGSKIQNGAHESVILHNGDTGWKIWNSLVTSFVSGGRSAITVYCSSSGGADGLELLYNTINACYGGNPASSAIAFENIGGGTITYNNIKMVGNILIGDNTGFSRAEIVLGTTATQNVTVNFTEFKRNAFDSVYYFGSSSASYPYNRLDSNLHNATAFIFVDSTGGDFRLGAGSPMKNAADSTYGCLVYGDFRAATKPFNVGFDQNFYNRWNYGKHPWIRTAAICYGVTDSIAGHFIGRHNDLMINPGNTAYGSRSGVLDNARRADSMVKALTYSTISSIREQDNQANGYIARFLARFPSFVRDSIYQWLDGAGGSVTLKGQQSSCGSQTNTINANDTVRVCGWSEPNRKVTDFRQPAARQFVKFKSVDVLSGEQAKYDGPFFDEFSTYLAPVNYFNSPTNSTYGMVYPFGASDWTPNTGYLRVRGWNTFTYAQIIDTCIKLKQRVWLKGVVDTLNIHGMKMFGNNADYDLLNYPSSSTTNIGEVWFDAMRTGSGLTMYENGNSPWIYGNATRGDKSRNAWLWQVMDSINAWDTGQIICWHDIMPQESLSVAGLGGWGRCQMERLVFHYMAASNRCWFLLTSNMPGPLLKPNDYIAGDTLFKWVPAADRDIGTFTGARFVATSGVDGAGQAYTLYRRNTDRAIFLYRAASGNPGSVGANTAISYNLGVTGTPVNVDNSLGAPSSVASIRNMEGQIWLTAGGQVNPTISISGCTTGEGGYCGMSANLSQAIAHDVRVTFNTTSGSATAGLDFTGQNNQIYTIPAGSTSVSIPVATLTDQLSENTESYLGTISSVQVVGGSEIIDQGAMSANGYIDDVPPQQSGGPDLLWRGVMPQ